MWSFSNVFSFLHNLQDCFEKHSEIIRVESSAKQMTLKSLDTFCRSFMYIKNKSGPRTLPWGIPVCDSTSDESSPLKDTLFPVFQIALKPV